MPAPTATHRLHRKLLTRFPAHLERFEEALAQAEFELVPDPEPEEVARSRRLVRDETDVPIALAAINANADYLISEDKDFTARDETTAELRERLAVLLSGTCLREVLGCTSDELEEIRYRS